MRMGINQVQAGRGSPWITGLRTGTQFLPGTPQYGVGQIGPGAHPHRLQSVIYTVVNSNLLTIFKQTT